MQCRTGLWAVQTLTRPKHPAPSLQKALSQNFRADQATAGNAAAIAVGKLWAHGFSIKNARSSWATIRPAIVAICKKYYLGNQAKGQAYYNACRISAGLGTLPDLGWVRVPLQNEKLAKTIDSCGLGAFLHQVKGGAQMMDAFNSGHDSLMQAVQQLVLSGARDWIEAAAKADPDSEGIRRVTGGTCDYCESLAGEGVTVAEQGWHNDCECTSEPTFNGDTGPSPSLPDSSVDASDADESDVPEVTDEDSYKAIPDDTTMSDIASAIENWVDSSSIVDADDVEEALVNGGTDNADANAIAYKLQNNPDTAPKLFRGMGAAEGDPKMDQFLADVSSGKVNFAPGSFSRSEKLVRSNFSGAGIFARGDIKSINSVVMTVDEGSKGIDVDNLYFAGEREVISGGKYDVVDVQKSSSEGKYGTTVTYEIKLRQSTDISGMTNGSGK